MRSAELRPTCADGDAVLIVTTSDAAAVVSTFAAIKKLASVASAASEESAPLPQTPLQREGAARLHVLVNMVPAARVAETVDYRLARACRRLLGFEPTIGWAFGDDWAGNRKSAMHDTLAKPSGVISRYRTKTVSSRKCC